MLAAEERNWIRENGYCTYHEPRLASLSEGEPFLHDGLLYYFDGRKLFLCGYPLDPHPRGAPERVLELAQRCMGTYPVEALSYYGPGQPSFGRIGPQKHRLLTAHSAEAINAEMVLDCCRQPESPRLRRWLRSSRRSEFRVDEVPGPYFTLRAPHFSLLERFFAAREMTPYLLDVAFLLPAMTCMQHVLWFEAYREGKLCGFSAVADAFRTTDLAVFLATDTGEAGTSDCLYASMSESARRRGKRYLNLGPSPSPGHYRFKEKWGAEPSVAPYWYCEWGFGELALGDYRSWPCRLLQYGFRPTVAGPSVRNRVEDARRVVAQMSRSE